MNQQDTCRCGHSRAAHEHFRAGSDCGRCPETCKRYEPVAAETRRPLPTTIRRLRRELRLI